MKTNIFLLAALSILLSGCWGLEQNGGTFHKVAPGNWRGVFSFEESDDRVPITFEVRNTDKEGEKTEIVFKNGDTVFQPDSLLFWGDTLYCHFFEQQTHLKMIYEVGLMQGQLYDKTKKEYPVRFLAQNGAYKRFPDLYETTADAVSLAGNWQIALQHPKDTALHPAAQLQLTAKETPVVFGKLTVQDSSMAVNIDLEGVVQKDKIYLSGFDGKRIVFLTATAIDKDYLDNGVLRINYETFSWNGKKTN